MGGNAWKLDDNTGLTGKKFKGATDDKTLSLKYVCYHPTLGLVLY